MQLSQICQTINWLAAETLALDEGSDSAIYILILLLLSLLPTTSPRPNKSRFIIILGEKKWGQKIQVSTESILFKIKSKVGVKIVAKTGYTSVDVIQSTSSVSDQLCQYQLK